MIFLAAKRIYNWSNITGMEVVYETLLTKKSSAVDSLMLLYLCHLIKRSRSGEGKVRDNRIGIPYYKLLKQ